MAIGSGSASTLPNVPIAFSPQFSEEPRTREVKFGDGYSLRTPDGLNTVSQKVTIPWRSRSLVEKETLVSFFRLNSGTFFFYWQPFGERLARKWICKSYSWEPVDGAALYWNITATLEEVHDLES